MSQPLVIVDGNSLWWRCHFSVGFPYANEFNFLSTLTKLAKDFRARIVIAWDSYCYWRRAVYPEYKASRCTTEKMAKKKEVLATLPDFIQNLQYVVPNYFAENYEADDVVAELIRQTKTEKKIIYGSDHDYLQLLWQPDVEMCRVRFNPTRTEMVNKQNIRELEGFTEEQAIWIQAICGDSSDSVPGCGVPKKLVIDILDHINKLTPYSFEDIHSAGAERLTPGWCAKWNNHFVSGAVSRNMKLMQLTARLGLKMQMMYQPDKVQAEHYLTAMGFEPIRQEVLALCNS